MRRAFRAAAILLLATSLSGCGTMINLGMGDIGSPRGTFVIYGAVLWDVDRIAEHPGVLVIMPLEFPLSLVFDTLFLPFTIVEALKSED
jgi:uncharacterized protein YceK